MLEINSFFSFLNTLIIFISFFLICFSFEIHNLFYRLLTYQILLSNFNFKIYNSGFRLTKTKASTVQARNSSAISAVLYNTQPICTRSIRNRKKTSSSYVFF
jgi:hypothetical protein